MFCYETTRVSVRTGDLNGASNFDPLKCNATKCFMEHYKNFLTLSWFANHGNIHEKRQANDELEICRRKMKYWERQPHFSAALATQEKAALHKAYAA